MALCLSSVWRFPTNSFYFSKKPNDQLWVFSPIRDKGSSYSLFLSAPNQNISLYEKSEYSLWVPKLMNYRTGLSYPNPSPLTFEALLDGSESTLAFSIYNLTFQSFAGLCQFLIGASSFPFFSFFVECAKAEQSLKYGMWLNPRPQCFEAS